MTYHQILRQPTSWIPKAGVDVKKCADTKTVCTIQASPLYLDEVYAEGNRSPTLEVDEFGRAINAVKDAGLDGVVIFTLSDLLRKIITKKDNRWLDILQTAKGEGSKSPLPLGCEAVSPPEGGG